MRTFVMRRRTCVLPQCAHLTFPLPYSLNDMKTSKRWSQSWHTKSYMGMAGFYPNTLVRVKCTGSAGRQRHLEWLEYNTNMPTDPQFGRDAHQPLLIVISGPSGAGKDSVVQRMQQRGLTFDFVTTATTRPRRPGEEHGKDYWFVSPEEFARMIEQNELMEYALVYGDYKGVPKLRVREALQSGRDVVLRLDVQGAETVRRLVPDALLIFITTESEEELISRLQERSTETPEALAIRVATTRQELRRVDAFDYLIVNHDDRLDHTVDVVQAIIEAEHHRVRQREAAL